VDVVVGRHARVANPEPALLEEARGWPTVAELDDGARLVHAVIDASPRLGTSRGISE
jgi:hypothetical protein